jgi:hypothetical protein
METGDWEIHLKLPVAQKTQCCKILSNLFDAENQLE